MRKYRVLFFLLVLAFIYCWIKFYAFFEGLSQGIFGSTTRGDVFFYLELILNFLVIAFFICSIFFSLNISKEKTQQQNRRQLIPAGLFFVLATFYGTLSYEDTNVFSYLADNYEDWSFFSDNFLMENIVLSLVATPVFLFKWISYYTWKKH